MIWSAELDAGNFQRKVRSNAPFREAAEAEIEASSERRALEKASGAMPSYALAEGWLMDVDAPAPAAEPRCAVGLRAAAATEMVSGSPDPVAAQRFDSLEDLARPRELDERARFPRRRGGRPASLWAAEDPSATLNSPIARPVLGR